jgi:hypothetical protein
MMMGLIKTRLNMKLRIKRNKTGSMGKEELSLIVKMEIRIRNIWMIEIIPR